MPVLFRSLPKEELGVWLLLGQSWVALGIFDFGLGVTLTRRIAFAKGKSGSDPSSALTEDALHDIADLVASGRRIYRALAVLALALSLGTGFFYLKGLEFKDVTASTALMAWGILCLGQAVGVSATIWTCLLQGVGYVGWEAVVASLVGLVVLLGQMVVALAGGGLVPLASLAAVGAGLQRVLIRGVVRRKRPELFSIPGRWRPQLLRSIASPALRAWITALGAAMILYTDQLLIASFRGAAEIPAYRAAFVLVHNLTILAVAFGGASSVFISHLWQDGQLAQVHRILERNVRLGWLIMLCGSACVLVCGPSFFSVWLGRGHFVGFGVIACFLVSETLEAQSYIIATTSRATEDEAFALSAITAGALKLFLSWWLSRWLGLVGIALGTTLALLSTNHWYMVYRGLHRLRLPFREYLLKVILPCGILFPVELFALLGVRRLLEGQPASIQVGGVLFAAALIFAASSWWLVLESSQRERLRQLLRLLPGRAAFSH
jgi:O-antigen/teichoic acid export membrane protein